MDKGTYGYIKYYKKRKFLYTSILLVTLLAIFIFGYKIDKRNECAIISVVMIIPMSKYLVALLISLPYKSMDSKDHKVIEEKKGNGCISYDFIFTSGEKIMNADCVYVDDKNITLLVTNRKQDLDYISKYIQEYCEGRLYNRKAVAYSDKEKFIDAIKGNNNKRTDENSEIAAEIFMLQI